jgi:hypothetical protein
MEGFELGTFVPQESHFTYETPLQPGDRLSEEYDIPWDAPSPSIPVQLTPEDTIQRVDPPLWRIFVPGDSVDRLQRPSSGFSTFTEIISDSFRNLKEDTYNDPVAELRQQQKSMEEDGSFQKYGHHPKEFSPQNWIKWRIGTTIAPIFHGTVDQEQVFSDEMAEGTESMTPRSGRNEIVIEKPVNNPGGRLARDIVKFEVDNCDDFFENAWTPSLVLRRLIRSDTEPISIEHTVEYPRDVPPYKGEISVTIGV